MDLAKTFERRKCNHREAIEGDECVMSVVGAYFSCCSAHRHWFTVIGLVKILMSTFLQVTKISTAML